MGRKRVIEDLMDLDAGLAMKKARKTEEVGNVLATKNVKAGLSKYFVEINEDHSVELPWIRERHDISWPFEHSEGGGPQHLVLV